MDPLLDWSDIVTAVRSKVNMAYTEVLVNTDKCVDKVLYRYSHKQTPISLPDIVGMNIVHAYGAVAASISKYQQLSELIDPAPKKEEPSMIWNGSSLTLSGRIKMDGTSIQNIPQPTSDSLRIRGKTAERAYIDDLQYIDDLGK